MATFTRDIKNTFLLHIPHSSKVVPFTNGFDLGKMYQEIEALTDHGAEHIFNVPEMQKIYCPWSRVFCDVERYESDPLEIIGQGFFYTKTSTGDFLRSDDTGIKNIVLQNFYKPYYDTLNWLIQNTIKEHGVCRIVDCHTFPTFPTSVERFYNIQGVKPDICIGINQNTPKYMEDHFVNHFKKNYLTVAVNFPYSGALAPYGYNSDELVSIMIEVNRNLLITLGRDKLLGIMCDLFENL